MGVMQLQQQEWQGAELACCAALRCLLCHARVRLTVGAGWCTQPKPHLSSHVSSACAGTCDCTKTFARAGSMPHAMYSAALLCVDCSSAAGSWGSVMACRSTTQKKVSACRRGRVVQCEGQPANGVCRSIGAVRCGLANGACCLPLSLRPLLPADSTCLPPVAPTVLLLQLDPVADGPEVVAQVQAASGLHARQHALAALHRRLAALARRRAAACLCRCRRGGDAAGW